MINFILTNEQDKVLITEEFESQIKEAVNTAISQFNISIPLEVSVTFTDNSGIKEINKMYRDIDSETDVLSFPQLEYKALAEIPETLIPQKGEYPYIMLGDIVLSLEKAKAQAIDFNHSFSREACYLTVHSVLHLLGYDHMEDEDKKLMREKEELIMEKLGLTR